MNSNDSDLTNTTMYKVVVNHEEQYSISRADKANPQGWRDAGKTGPKEECLVYINEVWTDMQPLSLRKKAEELSNNPPLASPLANSYGPREKGLVERLCEGDHVVEVGLRPEKTAKSFKEAIDRDYIHIKFTQTKGGSELGVRLDRAGSDFSKADFESGSGTAHVEGNLTLDYVKVKCIADIDLSMLTGKGRLVRIESA
jgi:uncharacterized protein YbdZ (MbtH family)